MSLARAHENLPVSVITGFLGSGKTTLLRHLLQDAGLRRTAVIVNEFGEIGIDHLLVERVDEQTLLLNSGCLCCTVRNDLIDTLRRLFLRRTRGEITEFDRVMIETTGLADPAPILHTLMSDPMVVAHYRLNGVITLVDAATAPHLLDEHFEAVKQVAVADRLVLNKIDLVDTATVEALESRLLTLNPGVPVLRATHGRVPPAALLSAGLYDPEKRTADLRGWLQEEAITEQRHHHHDHHHDHDDGHPGHHSHDADSHDPNRHDARIQAHCLSFDRPFPWDGVAATLDRLAETYGNQLLRLKGVLNVQGTDRPVVVHGVQHRFHPPATLPAWPDDDRRSRIVLITRDMTAAGVDHRIRAPLADCLRPTDEPPR